jgi:hypothetical protein
MNFGEISVGSKKMPTYTFKLRDDGAGVEDDIGINLPNADMAYGYACDVARELMRRRERRTQHWQLDVYHNAAKIFEIPFVCVDHTLDAGVKVRVGRSLTQRPHGRLYLVADRSQKVIRDGL